MLRSVKDIYWLAGLLEGEGYFTARKRSPCDTPGKKITCKIACKMTDLGVMKHLAVIVGPYAITPIPPQKKNYKPQHLVRIQGVNAAGWMMTLYSLMGTRRQTQIRLALTAWRYQENF